MTVGVDHLDQWARVTLDNSVIRAAVLPELGGKMISLVRQASGREFLLPPARPYRRSAWGDKFEEFDTSGFDECFPTVAECQIAERGFSRRFPDHGDLWSVPWHYEVKGEELLLSARGSSLPYEIHKKLQLDGNELIIEYKIENLSDQPFAYLWSAHPLLKTEAGATLLLPDDVHELLIEWSRDARLGKAGQRCAYPVAAKMDGGVEDLGVVKSASAGTADKLFTPRLKTGWCGLHFPGSDQSIAFRFDVKQIGYVGLWLCQGGWPQSTIEKHFTIALEPCNAPTDSLGYAIEQRECPTLAARSSERWTLRVELCSGIPNLTYRGLTTR